MFTKTNEEARKKLDKVLWRKMNPWTPIDTTRLNKNKRAIAFARQRAMELQANGPLGPPDQMSLNSAKELLEWADKTETELEAEDVH
jgi:hypothetical protein